MPQFGIYRDGLQSVYAMDIDSRRRWYHLNLNAPLTDPFPLGFNFIQWSCRRSECRLGRGLRRRQSGHPPARVQPELEFQDPASAAFEHGAVEVAYAGNSGTRPVARRSQLDQLDPSLLSLGNRLLAIGPQSVLRDCRPSELLAQPTVQYGQLLRPFPAIWNGVSAVNAAWSNSNYNALQTRFEKAVFEGVERSWFPTLGRRP